MLIQSPGGWSQHLQFGDLNWITMSDLIPPRFLVCLFVFLQQLDAAVQVTFNGQKMQSEWALEAALHFLIPMIVEIMDDFCAGWFHGVPAGLARHW